jgi:GPH family glycoside/pentoside/hexuronide:cation symporter
LKEKKMKKPLSNALKRFYGIGDFGFTLMANVELYYLAYFLTNVAKFDLATTALIMTTTSMIDVILSPFYGGIIDGMKPMKWGRYRSWLLVMPPIVTLFYTLEFTTIGTGVVPVVIIIGAYLVAHIFWNFSYVANVALIPTISSTPEDRAQLSATRGAYNNAGKLAFSAVGLATVLYIGTAIGNPVLGFTLVALAMALVYWVTYFLHFKMTDGYEETHQEASQNKKKKEKTSIMQMAKSLVQNPHLLVLLLADLTRWIVNFVMAGSAAYFFTYVTNNVAMFSVYLLVANGMALIGSYLSKYAASKFTTRTAGIFGFYALGVFLLISQFFVNDIMIVLVFLSCAQFFLGFIYALISAMYSDAVIYSEWKTGSKASGWIMGLMNLPLKIANLIKGAIIPAVLAAVGFVAKMDPATATPELKTGIVQLFVIIPGIGILVGAVLLTVGYRLTRAKITNYQKEIDERQAIVE